MTRPSFACACLAGAAVLLSACAGSEQARVREPLPPLTEAQALLFDDGVDLIDDPEALDGRWYDDWSRELEQRLAEADEVFVGSVQTVRADVDLARRTTYRIVFKIDRRLKGAVGKEHTLSSAQGAVGHASVERNRDRLLGRTFVAFVKRAGGEAGPDVPHFHLTPPSPPLDARLLKFEADQRPNAVRVIEHEN